MNASLAEKDNQKEAIYLFNLIEDPLEINNIADENPDLVAFLEKKLDEYKKSVVEPLNPPSLKPDRNADPSNWYVKFLKYSFYIS